MRLRSSRAAIGRSQTKLNAISPAAIPTGDAVPATTTGEAPIIAPTMPTAKPANTEPR